MNSQTEKYALLRRALQTNSGFSALSGIIIILANNRIASIIGLPEEVSLIGLGISLLLFAASLFWVAGSIALISANALSASGNLAVAAVVAIVLLFALLQFLAYVNCDDRPQVESEPSLDRNFLRIKFS